MKDKRIDKMKTKITIRKDGTIVGILDEGFDTSEIGTRSVTRLSDVYWSDKEQGWIIHDRMKMQNIPRTFKTRKSALDYEKWYMERRMKKVISYAGVL